MDEIEITILEDDDLPQREPSYPKDAYKKWLSPDNASVRVICSQKVFESVEHFSKDNRNSEVGGVLLGTAYRHNGNIYVEVREYIKATTSSAGQSGMSYFTFTPETWAEMLRIKDARFGDLKMVGWFHSHPGHGIFLSTMDVSIHDGHFKSPWHIAMVYDPLRHHGGFFIWENNRIVQAPGFYELFNPGQKKSIVSWKNLFRPVQQIRSQYDQWWLDAGVWSSAILLVFVLVLAMFFYQNIQLDNLRLDAVERMLKAEQTSVAVLKRELAEVNSQLAAVAPTATIIPTITETPTITLTPMDTGTPTFTSTASPTNTSTATPTRTKIASATPSLTVTLSPDVTPTK